MRKGARGDGVARSVACSPPPSAAEPYTTLAVGESVSVRAEFEAHHWTMYALVCNATECSRLEMGRNGSDHTRLVFEPATGCGWPLWRQCRHQKYIVRVDSRPLQPFALPSSLMSDPHTVHKSIQTKLFVLQLHQILYKARRKLSVLQTNL